LVSAILRFKESVQEKTVANSLKDILSSLLVSNILKI